MSRFRSLGRLDITNVAGMRCTVRQFFKYDPLQILNIVSMSTLVSSLLPTSVKLASELNMSDILTALGPGRKLDSLASFASDYVTVRRAFNNLLVFPHLEAIDIGDTSNLQSLVMDGNSRFSGLSNIDSGLARKVISYDVSFSALVNASHIQLLVKTLQPVAQEYADHARVHSEANLKFFADASHHPLLQSTYPC